MNRQNIYPYSKKHCFEPPCFPNRKGSPSPCGMMPQAEADCLLPLYSNNIKEASI